MKRREFIGLLGGAAAWPVPVRAQQLDTPVLGFLSGRAPDEAATHTAAFFRALADTGFIPGQNLAVEYRWAEGRYDRLPILAQDLTRRRVSFIAAVGGSNSALAAKAATSTTPIVFYRR